MMSTESETTQMYTTENLVDYKATGSDEIDDDCTFSLALDLDSNEGIEFSLCAYEDEDNKLRVGLTFVVPVDRWVAVGFVAASDFVEENAMANAYAFVIPANSRSGIHSRYMNSRGDIGDKLTSLSNLYSDEIVDDLRTVRMIRKATVALEELDDATVADFDKYYDFSSLRVGCEELDLQVIYAYAATANTGFPSSHGSNTGSVTVDEKDLMIRGFSCDHTDAAFTISLFYATLMVLAASLIHC